MGLHLFFLQKFPWATFIPDSIVSDLYLTKTVFAVDIPSEIKTLFSHLAIKKII